MTSHPRTPGPHAPHHRSARGATVSDEAILEAVAAGHEGCVSLLCDLVREDSRLGREAPAQDRMEREFVSLGLQPDRFAVDLSALRDQPGFSPPILDYDGRENVVGIHRPRAAAAHPAGRSLILNGHIDVVPTGPEDMWTTPPFEPSIRDGRLYGRGGGDMKAGLAACVGAFRALRSLGVQPAAPVYLQSVIEEECTGNGALACLHRGYRADAAIIPEPFAHSLMIAQLGVMWFSVTVRGRPAHVFEASAGVNAIEAAFEIFSALKALEASWNHEHNRHPSFRDHVHPINFNIGRIEGGEWPSSVPCQCRFEMRIAFFPGVLLEHVRAAVEHTVHDAVGTRPALASVHATVEYSGFQADGCVVDAGSDMMNLLSRLHGHVMGWPAEYVGSTACTDVRAFSLYGDIPATCYGPEATHIHGIDESVSLASVQHVTGVLALFMAHWCGLEPARPSQP